MLPRPSIIQKCSHCGRYFFYEDSNPKPALIRSRLDIAVDMFYDKVVDSQGLSQEPVDIEEESEMEKKIHEEAYINHFGHLSYHELLQAGKDILIDGITMERRIEYLISLLHAYNDAGHGRAGVEKATILENDHKAFRDCALELIDCFGEGKTLTAELWRELGEFDKSIEVCQGLIAKGTDVNVVHLILERAKEHDQDVFILHFDT